MNPEDVKILIDQLLKTGEILATKAFELAVKQVYVEIVRNFIGAGILLAICIAGIFMYRAAKNSEYGDFWHGMEVVGFLTTIFSGAIFAMGIMEGISRLMNPEWYAVQLLLEQFLK